MEALELARQILLMLAPLVAQGALAKIGEDTTDRVTQLIGQAWGLLRGATHGTPRAESALEVFQDEPDDQRNQERLIQHLAGYLNQHHQVVDELKELVTQLQAQIRQAGLQVNFTNSGENHGQQVGVNHGTMGQSRQDIHNHASNQGAQGSLHGPVSFTRQEVSGDRAAGIAGDAANSPITTGDSNAQAQPGQK